MSEPTLKCCPFCGSDDVVSYQDHRGMRVRCNTCAAKAPVAAWNQRTPAPVGDAKTVAREIVGKYLDADPATVRGPMVDLITRALSAARSGAQGWRELVTSENYKEPDLTEFFALREKAYGWTLTYNGEISGLVAGDMGYDTISLTLNDLVVAACGEGSPEQKRSFELALGTLISACAAVLPAPPVLTTPQEGE